MKRTATHKRIRTLQETVTQRQSLLMISTIKTSLTPLLIYAISNLSYAKSNSELDYLSLSLEELGKIKVSIATGNNTTLEQAPAAATVITAQQIEALGASTLDDVLETVPGLHVSLSGGNRLDSVYSIRGINTTFNAQVLLLVNGFPLQFPFTGGRPTLFRQPVNNISRIEVIRGPGSAIYGADAFSGVINIITKSADEINGTEVGSRIGSFGFREVWANTGKKFKDWNVNFSLNHQRSDGDSDRIIDSDLQTTFDNAFGTSASLAPGALSTRYEIIDASIGINNKNWAFNARTWQSNNSGNGAGAAQALDPNSTDDVQLITTDLSYSNSWLSDWNNSIKVNYAYINLNANFNVFPEGSTLGIGTDGNLSTTPSGLITFTDGLIGNPNVITEDVQLESINTYEGFNNHRVRFTLGSRYQSVDTSEDKNFGPGVITDPTATPVIDGTLTDVSDTENVFLEDTSRTINFFSLQDEWSINNAVDLIAGVRYDDYSDFGDTTNPRIALVWHTNKTLTTKLLYGSAFRAPSFGELGLQNNPSALGNPDLEPETIDTFELAFNYRPRSYLQSNLNLFSYQAKDLIEFVPSPVGSTSQNARDQEGYGFEWEVNWEPNKRWRFNSSFAWQETKDSDTNDDIPDVPGQQFTLNSFWKITPQWLLSTRINWVGDRIRAVSDNRSDIDDYTIVDFTLRRKGIYKGLDVALGMRNAFDEDAREPSMPSGGALVPIVDDLPLEGRSFWAEVRYQF